MKTKTKTKAKAKAKAKQKAKVIIKAISNLNRKLNKLRITGGIPENLIYIK